MQVKTGVLRLASGEPVKVKYYFKKNKLKVPGVKDVEIEGNLYKFNRLIYRKLVQAYMLRVQRELKILWEELDLIDLTGGVGCEK